jgi:hypothetical protein
MEISLDLSSSHIGKKEEGFGEWELLYSQTLAQHVGSNTLSKVAWSDTSLIAFSVMSVSKNIKTFNVFLLHLDYPTDCATITTSHEEIHFLEFSPSSVGNYLLVGDSVKEVSIWKMGVICYFLKNISRKTFTSGIAQKISNLKD